MDVDDVAVEGTVNGGSSQICVDVDDVAVEGELWVFSDIRIRVGGCGGGGTGVGGNRCGGCCSAAAWRSRWHSRTKPAFSSQFAPGSK